MASFQSKMIESILKASPIKEVYAKGLLTKKEVSSKAGLPPAFVYNAAKVKMKKIANRNVVFLQPKDNVSNLNVLFLHGGAYLFGMSYLHWKFVVKLMHKSKCSMMIPDYPLAPFHTADEAFSMLIETYKELIAMNDSSQIVLMGDSAGGGLALALAMLLKKENLPQPRRIILLSPWLDAELSNPDIPALAKLDPILDVEGLKEAGNVYEPSTEGNMKLISPIHGDLTSLARISCFAGTKEIMVADTRKLKAKLESLGIESDNLEDEDMLHDWILLGIPESKEMIRRLTKILRETI